MNKTIQLLGARLNACASFVRAGRIPADIGTDHAYLPILLVGSGKNPRAYASDINDEPVRLAKENIEKYQLSDKIITFTADGLACIPPDDVDDIIIAGMGGDNIAAILGAADWLKHPRYRLVLQPMSHAERLRAYLYANGFAITEELPVCEAKRLYTVICAEYRETLPSYSEWDIYAGKLPRDNPYGRSLMIKQAGILYDTADGMEAKGHSGAAAHQRALAERLKEYAKGGQSS